MSVAQWSTTFQGSYSDCHSCQFLKNCLNVTSQHAVSSPSVVSKSHATEKLCNHGSVVSSKRLVFSPTGWARKNNHTNAYSNLSLKTLLFLLKNNINKRYRGWPTARPTPIMSLNVFLPSLPGESWLICKGHPTEAPQFYCSHLNFPVTFNFTLTFKLIKLNTWTTDLSNSMKLWDKPFRATQDGQVMWRVQTKCGPLEKEMATHSSVLALRIPGTGEPGGLLSMGSQRVRHDWSNLAAAETSSGDKMMDLQFLRMFFIKLATKTKIYVYVHIHIRFPRCHGGKGSAC